MKLSAAAKKLKKQELNRKAYAKIKDGQTRPKVAGLDGVASLAAGEQKGSAVQALRIGACKWAYRKLLEVVGKTKIANLWLLDCGHGIGQFCCDFSKISGCAVVSVVWKFGLQSSRGEVSLEVWSAV